MRSSNLAHMKKGWFIGDFSPSLCQTGAVEVAVKAYCQGDAERAHVHRIATEFTCVVCGRVQMFGQEWGEGDIIIAEPGDVTGFLALTDAKTAVVKIPGAANDKYPANT